LGTKNELCLGLRSKKQFCNFWANDFLCVCVCVLVVTLLLFYAGFRLAAYLSRCRILTLCLALLRSGREFHSKLQASGYTPSSVYPIVGYLFCTVASCLQLIIANSNACNEGGVSSLLSNPRASTRHCLNTLSILI